MQNVQIPLNQTIGYACKACKNETFDMVYFIRVVPAIISPTLKAEFMPMPAFQCSKCTTIAELNPKTSENGTDSQKIQKP